MFVLLSGHDPLQLRIGENIEIFHLFQNRRFLCLPAYLNVIIMCDLKIAAFAQKPHRRGKKVKMKNHYLPSVQLKERVYLGFPVFKTVFIFTYICPESGEINASC